MNYYPFHIGDYLSATRHLNWEEDCAYRRLLDTYYVTEKALPSDLRSVCRLVMASTDAQREAVEIVLKEFFILTEAGWVNERADAEIDEMKSRQQIAKAKADKRWDKHRAERSKAAAMPEDEKTDAAALKTDADAMLPTPTPTPTPKVNNKERAPRFDAQAHLVGLEVDPVIAADWIKLRKTKRAEVTATAIDGVSREAEKAGMSLDAALRECCSRGWAGFKADWMQARDSPGRVLQHQSVEQRNKAVAAAWVPPEMRGAA